MRKIAIVKAGQTFPHLATRLGDFSDWMLAGLGVAREEALVVPAYAGAELPSAGELRGVLISGAHAMVTEASPWMLQLQRWLAGLVRDEVPVLGICFGHQILASALGGKVDYHPRGQEVGTVEVRLLPEAGGDALLGGMPSVFPANVFHSQTVVQLPPGARVLARNDFEPHHAVAYAPRAWGVQFHPEFNTQAMRAYIDDQAEVLQKAGSDPQLLLAQVRETPASFHLLANFAALLG